MIRLLPGMDAARAIEVVTHQRNAVHSLNDKDFEAVRLYVEWVSTTSTVLRGLVDETDIADLLFTRGYDRLLDVFNSSHRDGELTITTKRVVNTLVQQELAEQRIAFDRIIERLRYESVKWSDRGGPGRILVPDTNFYLHHEGLFGESNFIESLRQQSGGIRIVIPILIIEELDKHKFGTEEVRSRARQTIKTINERFDSPNSIALLADGPDGSLNGAAIAELLLDLPGHRRQPRNDDEIRDRALAIQIVSGRPVTIATFDLGMSLAARLLGLDVLKLDPPERRSTRAVRKERTSQRSELPHARAEQI
jgi:hypothetical protein